MVALSRATLPNFLADPVALLPFGGNDGAPGPLEDAFLVDSPDGRFRAVWDPTACRLLGVIDLSYPDEAPPAPPGNGSDGGNGDDGNSGDDGSGHGSKRFPLLASGAAPFSLCEGVFGQPAYFGFRLEDDRPEFLYRHGRVSVEESLRFSEDGSRLVQRLRYKEVGGAPLLSFPEAWRALAETDGGEWQTSPLLKLPETESKEGAVEIRYALPDSPGPESFSPPGRPDTASPPAVKAIAPLDGKNALFLTRDNRVAVAKFSPELELLAWKPCAPVSLETLPGLAAGKNLSAIFASSRELTQGFPDRNKRRLDFFQALARPGRGGPQDGRITAGPATDRYGRILYALAPGAREPAGEDGEDGENGKRPDKENSLLAWSPGTGESEPVLSSSLPIVDLAVSPRGTIATLLRHDGYQGGYYLSLNDLPEPVESDSEQRNGGPRSSVAADGEQEQEQGREKEKDKEKEKELGASPPEPTRPSVILPAELTGGQPPRQIRFLTSGDEETLIALSTGNRRLIEISPEKISGQWQGSVLVRSELQGEVSALADLGGGRLLGGGAGGFAVLPASDAAFRVSGLRLAEGGIRLTFTRPLDRSSGAESARYSLRSFGLHDGSRKDLPVGDPVIDADGRSVFLPAEALGRETVLVVTCAGLRSESGGTLIENKAYFTRHR